MKPLLLPLLLLPAIAFGSTPIDETRELAPDARVSLDNLKGTIRVTVWDRSEIRLSGRLGEGTEGLEIRGDARDLDVRIKYPEQSGWFGGWGSTRAGDSDLEVTLPAGVKLEVESVSAEIDVRGIAGPSLSIENVSGDVHVETAATEVSIENVSGDQEVQANSREARLETVSGEIRLRGSISDRASLEAVSGSLTFESDAPLRSVTAGVVSGDVTLETRLAPGGRISAESLSGDVELVLPADSSARLEASSFTGTIRSDQGSVEKAEHGPGSSLSVTLGSGDGKIELETFSGDLRVRMR